MKKKIIYYKKCLCCGDIQGYVMRDRNVNSGTTDQDVLSLVISGRDDGVSVDWCERCNMNTKQEKIAWDYISETKATPPKKHMNKQIKDATTLSQENGYRELTIDDIRDVATSIFKKQETELPKGLGCLTKMMNIFGWHRKYEVIVIDIQKIKNELYVNCNRPKI